MELYTLHLFAGGGGGGILADLLLGHCPVGAVEIEPFQRSILLRNQLAGNLPNFPVWDDVTTFRKDNPATGPYITRLEKIRDQLCICGGFPCQDISAANPAGKGLEGSRSGLYFEMLRIVREIRPQFVFLENSPIILTKGVEKVFKTLSEVGYHLAYGIVSGSDAGAPHLRKRWWCLGCADTEHGEELRDGIPIKTQFSRFENASDVIPYISEGAFRRRHWGCSENKTKPYAYRRGEEADNRRQRRGFEPRLDGMADGLPDWLDRNLSGDSFPENELNIPRLTKNCPNRRKRLETLGNAQVPQSAALAFLTLKQKLEEFSNEHL